MGERASEGEILSAKREDVSSSQGINFDDPSLSSSYGAEIMNKIAQFSDTLLQGIQMKDAGLAGEQLSALLEKVRGSNFSETSSKGGLASIPFIGKLFDKSRSLMTRYKSVSEEITEICTVLEDAQLKLLKDIEILEQLYLHNSEFYGELSACIEKGERELDGARKGRLVELTQKAEQSGDGLDAQRAGDFAETLNRFERRIHDLKVSRTVTLQTAPQIRMIQNSDRMLAQKIQASVLTAVPIWKNQVVLALSLQGQQNAAKLQQDVADTTEELLKRNADMLHQASTDAARQNERPLVSIETLQHTQQELIAAVEETIEIAREGHETRLKANAELANMEQQLKDRLLSLGAQKRAQSKAFAEAKENNE